MFVIFSQVLILLIFVAAGFVLGKTGIVKQEHTKSISSLLVYAILPCNVFKTFAERFTPTNLAENYKLFLISVAVLCVLVVAAHFGAKLFTGHTYDRCVYAYSLAVPNYGYAGYALAEALFGQVGLMNFMVFTLPVSIYVYTIGFAKLTKQGVSLKKLLNPVIIGMVLGIVVGLTGLQLPTVVNDVVGKSAACMAPLSMLFTGIVISGFSVRSMLSDVKTYIMAALRLLVIPVAVGLALSLFCEKEVVLTAVLFAALPCGLNTVVFPKLVDENCQIGASLALISTVLSCITFPLVLTLFQMG